jgi:Ni,Fe-hydrogenase III large subunit/Ni,Fe-hydrogenase III component G
MMVIVGQDGIRRAGWQPAPCGHLQTSARRVTNPLQVANLPHIILGESDLPGDKMDLIDELRDKFPDLVSPSPQTVQIAWGQVSIGLRGPDVRPLAEHLRLAYESRLVAVFAEDRVAADGVFYNYYVFEQPGEPCYVILQAPIAADQPRFPSLAAELPAVNWQEREIQDWFGLEAAGHPNPRRVALHDNWPDVHPLRKSFPLRQTLPPFEGERHVYRPTLGEGVFQIPVGPVHAGIIEPGHFNFAVAGEPILYLQLRMFYTHKATEKLFEDLPIARAVFLAESISGDSAFSHGTAFCQAIENAAGTEVPPRALVMRTILLELERVCNHIGDIGGIATDVGFMVANAHASRLREMVVRLNEGLTGSRWLRGMVCVGGVRRDWSAAQLDLLRDTVNQVEREFDSLVALVQASDSTRDRLEHTGILRPETAKVLGIVGVAGRASGVDLDVRRDHPYAAYPRYRFRVPVYQAGDVLHRMLVRIDEAKESFAILRAAANDLFEGDLREGPRCAPTRPVPPGRCALSAVEGWRGEILHWVRTADGNRLERCKIKDPSVNNWAAVVEAVQGNIIADFPVINKSFNLSYSGTDR